jgi:hypothetical protein
VYWAALVVAVYRLLASRCLETLDGILKHRLEEDPSDQELATKRVSEHTPRRPTHPNQTFFTAYYRRR